MGRDFFRNWRLSQNRYCRGRTVPRNLGLFLAHIEETFCTDNCFVICQNFFTQLAINGKYSLCSVPCRGGQKGIKQKHASMKLITADEKGFSSCIFYISLTL